MTTTLLYSSNSNLYHTKLYFRVEWNQSACWYQLKSRESQLRFSAPVAHSSGSHSAQLPSFWLWLEGTTPHSLPPRTTGLQEAAMPGRHQYSGTGSRLMSNKGKSALFFICCLQNRLCSLQTVKMLWQHPYWTAYTVGGAKGADLDRMILSPWVLFSLYLSPSFCIESQKNTSLLLLNHRKLIVLLLMKASALLFQNFL